MAIQKLCMAIYNGYYVGMINDAILYRLRL